jgi:hypothetical protein
MLLVLVLNVQAYAFGVLTPAASEESSGGGASSLDQVTSLGNTSTGNTEGNPFEIFGSGAYNTTGWQIGTTSGGVPFLDCYISSILRNCDRDFQLYTGKKFRVKNNAGTTKFEVDEATGGVTAATVDGETSGVSITLYQKLCGGELAAINPSDSAAYHVWNKDPLSTAPTLTARSGTNRGTAVLTFPDSDGDYGVQLTCVLPPGFTGNLDGVIWWDTTGTGNARFQVQTKCYADDEADDAAFNTASVVTAAAGTSGRPNRQAISAITITGCAADELVRVRFYRNRTEASDTLNAALNVERFELWARNAY